jgi:hypothetical protein
MAVTTRLFQPKSIVLASGRNYASLDSDLADAQCFAFFLSLTPHALRGFCWLRFSSVQLEVYRLRLITLLALLLRYYIIILVNTDCQKEAGQIGVICKKSHRDMGVLPGQRANAVMRNWNQMTQ